MNRLLIVLILLMFAFNAEAQNANSGLARNPNVTVIDAQTLKTKLANNEVAVVDIRTVEEWAETGVIRGSYLLSAFDEKGEFDPVFNLEIDAAISKNEHVVIVCRSGGRSLAISNYLTGELEYKNVYDLKGGILDWIKVGGALESVQ